jgi:hypothetical protein
MLLVSFVVASVLDTPQLALSCDVLDVTGVICSGVVWFDAGRPVFDLDADQSPLGGCCWPWFLCATAPQHRQCCSLCACVQQHRTTDSVVVCVHPTVAFA